MHVQEDRPSRTAEIVAAMRASEGGRRIPLVVDPFARGFVSLPYAWATHLGPLLDRIEPVRRSGMHNYIATRHAWMDGVVRERRSADVLVLGAGYDTRCLRLGGAQYWEVDHPATAGRKRALAPNHPAIQVEVDFERQALEERLRSAGFAPTGPCSVVWEGVSMYLSRHAFVHTLTTLAALVPRGSTLCFDALGPSEGTDWRSHATRMSLGFMPLIGEAIRFMPHPADLRATVEAAGWRVTEVQTARELGEAAGRFVFPSAYVVACELS